MKRWALAIVVAGCSYTFDSEAPLLPLIGTPPDTRALPHLNTKPVDGEAFARGADGRVWLVMHQSDNSWRMIPMSGDTSTVETITSDQADDVFVAYHALYITKQTLPENLDGGIPDGGVTDDGGIAVFPVPPTDMGMPQPPVQLTVRSIAEHPGKTFLVPSGPAVLFSGANDNVFVYMVTDQRLPGYLIQQRDDSFHRIVPWPKGVAGAVPFKNGAFFFDNTGKWFLDRDADGRIVAHSTTDNSDVDIGIRPRFLGWVDERTLITCGPDGLRTVRIDGKTPERILDADICKPQLLWLNRDSRSRHLYAYYDVGTTVRKKDLDSDAAPQSVFDFGTSRVMVITSFGDTVLYSTDPADRYVHGAGDGWLGNWKFMDRGTGVSMSNDRLHIHWLEHSAQGTGAGQLMSVTLPAPGQPGGTPVTLTRNTRQFSVLDDGRIICDENHAYAGTENRIVVVDETRKHKQYVATGATHYSSIPDAPGEFIVDVITGASDHHVVRVKVPPIEPAPPPNK